MLLLEADGKALFRSAGIPTPIGVSFQSGEPMKPLHGAGPWIAKAQVPVGGRGKAGGVRRVGTVGELPDVLDAMLGMSIKGCVAREVLVEEAAAGDELYLALMVDAGGGGVRLIYSALGGVDIESHAPGEQGCDILLPLDRDAMREAAIRAGDALVEKSRPAFVALCHRLIDLFLEQQLMLAEINPLFALPDGSFMAGDAKVVIDMNAVHARPHLKELLVSRKDHYPEAWRKFSLDFDFIEIHPRGEVGLVTTGAGLSMMLIDELVKQGISPYNFCDMRTGQMRGKPDRLLQIFDALSMIGSLRVVLVNIFAGITDLSEFTQLLIQAREMRPEFRLPMIARLVGNGEAAAKELLAARSDLGIVFEPDLERAIALARVAIESSDQREKAHAL